MTVTPEMFATVDPGTLGPSVLTQLLLGGNWFNSSNELEVVDPLSGNVLHRLSLVAPAQLHAFADSLTTCPSYGLHNPFHNVERYVQLGEVFRKVGNALLDPIIGGFFASLIQRVMPKSLPQCLAEVKVTGLGFVNFAGDNVRFHLGRGFSVTGDRLGQRSNGYRWPYGPVMIVSPFNFPLEIPALQLLGALAAGNKVLLKCDPRTAIVMEQFLRLMIACGLRSTDVDLMHCDGETTDQFLTRYAEQIRLVQFTGSSRVAERVSQLMRGRVRIEDAGFDWKLLGPDSDLSLMDYIAWQCDQDAYAASGQKCSAQSLLFAHSNWMHFNFVQRLEQLAARRQLADLSIGPVLTWTTKRMLAHIEQLLMIPGAKLLFGGRELSNHSIPKCYGAMEPTAVQVPLTALLDSNLFGLITTELFGPLQIIVEYDDSHLDAVLGIFERLGNRLTAAVVSRYQPFVQRVLGATTNGTTYAGPLARTTGAPQNHFFGPCSDPRGAGIGTPEAIISTWTCSREIIMDDGPIPSGWTMPAPT